MRVEFEELPPKYQEQALKQIRGKQDRESKTPAPAPAAAPEKKPPKYHNVITMRWAIKFHSKKEAGRFEQLRLRLRAGEIRKLRLQQDFTLQEGYTDPETGERVRAIRYKADFAYERATEPDRTGEVHWIRVVEDVKSRPTRTKDYILKRKMMQDKLGIQIQEV